jgi:hypothetical protein
MNNTIEDLSKGESGGADASIEERIVVTGHTHTQATYIQAARTMTSLLEATGSYLLFATPWHTTPTPIGAIVRGFTSETAEGRIEHWYKGKPATDRGIEGARLQSIAFTHLEGVTL